MAKSSAARAEARFKQLCCLRLGGEAVMPALLNELRTVVPSFGSTFFFLDANGTLVNVYDENPEAPHVAPLYMREFYNRPEREMGLGISAGTRRKFGVQGVEDILTVDMTTFERSDYYNLILRPLGYAEAIRLAIWDDNRPVGGVMLLRSSGEGRFTPEDSRRLAGLESFFAHALTQHRESDAPLVDSGRVD